MTKIKQFLSTPGRIAAFALCVVLVVSILAFAGIKAGASVANGQGIGLNQATQVALQNAGFEESEVSLLRGHFDKDDGISAYDIEFRGNDGFDYDYTISANDGTIIEVNKEMAEKSSVSQEKSEGKTETDKSSSGKTESSGSGSQSSTAVSSDSKASSSSGSSGKTQSSQSGSGLIGVEKAKSIALQNAGLSASKVTFIHAYQDRDDGIYVYEIEFVSGGLEYDYEIHGTTGTILDKDVDTDDDYYRNSGSQSSADLIGVSKAKSIAASDAGFSTSSVNFIKAYQDYDDGIYVYEVEFVKGELKYEYEIHGTKGVVMDKDIDHIYD